MTSVLALEVCLNVIKAFGPVHINPGQLLNLGKVSDPGFNFALVYGLTIVTVHMSFPLPWGNFERQITRKSQGFP